MTVRVISSDPQCKDDNARFTTVPLEAFSDQVFIRYLCFVSLKVIIFIFGFYVKVTCAFFVH